MPPELMRRKTGHPRGVSLPRQRERARTYGGASAYLGIGLWTVSVPAFLEGGLDLSGVVHSVTYTATCATECDPLVESTKTPAN